MLDVDTKRYINNARNVLVGKVPNPISQVDMITIALIYKFMDDIDLKSVELGSKRQYFTGSLKDYAWSNLLSPKQGNQSRLNLYAEALNKLKLAKQIPPLFRNIFKDAFLPFRDGETLSLFLKEINNFNYDNSETIGNAFEYLLSIMGSQGDAGQFRTPRHIIDFIVNAVCPTKTDKILDPACGTAGFLISAYKYILNTTKEKKLTRDEKDNLTHNIIGYDIDPTMAKLALVNLYLHNFLDPKVYEYDTLTSTQRWGDKFDVIFANPPFMTPKGGIKPHDKFSIQANRSEVLFVDYIAEHLNLGGRAGIIVPEGIIFQSGNAYKNLRKMFIEDNYLYAVVSLPAGVFNPYSGVKTSILFFDKRFSKKNDSILFVKIDNDGFDLGAQRRPISANDLPEALKIINDWKADKNVSKKDRVIVANKKQIAENGDYNLSAERYRIVEKRGKQKWEMVKLGDVCEFISGYAFKSNLLKTQKESPKEYPIVKIGNITSNGIDVDKIEYHSFIGLEKYIIRKGDILIAMTGATVGKMCVSQLNNCLINQRACIIRGKTISNAYLSYLLKAKEFYDYCQNNAGGGAQGNISPTQILTYKIPLPPLEVQEQIVAEIEVYQKIIDGARQVIENWKPKIKVDEKWEMVKLGDEKYFEIESGGTPSTNNKSYWDGNVDWISLVDLSPDNRITNIVSTKRTITEKGLKNSSAKLLPLNTIVVSSRATIGRVGITKIPLATNQGFKNIIVKDVKKINPDYIANIVIQLKDQMINLASGGTFTEISKTNFGTLTIPLPPLDVQEQIVAEIEVEQKAMGACKELIKIYENKINETIKKVWSE